MGKTATAALSGEANLAGVDRAIKDRAAALEALRRMNEAAYDGLGLQKQWAGERFEASPKRRAKYAAWLKAMERGEPVALDYGPDWEEAERWACAEISRRAGAEAGFELGREPGVTYVRATRERPHRGRSPRPATNGRRRGSRRSPARRSSERSGDSGSEDGESEPSRTCSWCGTAIDHLNADAKYCGAKHRVYAQRERDRLAPERVAERSANGAPHPKRCKCHPEHNVVDRGGCVLCGHARGNGEVASGIPAGQLSVQRPSGAREWRTRPSRSESARLRRTRRDYIDESIIKAVAA